MLKLIAIFLISFSLVTSNLQHLFQILKIKDLTVQRFPTKGNGLVANRDFASNEPFFEAELADFLILERDFPFRKELARVLKNNSQTEIDIAEIFLNAVGLVFYTHDQQFIQDNMAALKLSNSTYFPLSYVNKLHIATFPEEFATMLTYTKREIKLIDYLFPDNKWTTLQDDFDNLYSLLEKRLENLNKQRKAFFSEVLLKKEKIRYFCSAIMSRGSRLELSDNDAQVKNMTSGRNRNDSIDVLYPGLEFASNCYQSNFQGQITLRSKRNETKVQFYFTSEIKKNEEICFSYTKLDNLGLLSLYGFIDFNNPNDKVSESFDFIVSFKKIQFAKEHVTKVDENVVTLSFYRKDYQLTMNLLLNFLECTPEECLVKQINRMIQRLLGYNFEKHFYLEQETRNYAIINKENLVGTQSVNVFNFTQAKIFEMQIVCYHLLSADFDLEDLLDSDLKKMVKKLK